MARESANIIQQIGVQSAFGTPASSVKKTAGISFDLGDKLDVKKFRRKGAKSDTTSIINKIWMEGKFDLPGSYNELVYILACLFPYTLTTGSPVVGTNKWAFLPVAEGNDDAKFLTIEEGDDEAAERYQDVILQSLDINFSRDDVTANGNCFAKPLDASFSTLTAGASILAERPIAGSEIDVYMDSSFGAIGTTKVTDAFMAKFSMPNKRDPKWVMNTSEASWKDAKEVKTEASLSITTEHNSQSRAIRAAILNNAPSFFRIEANGPIITGSTKYRFRLDFCGKIANPNRQPDVDGIYGYEYVFEAFQESTMNRGYSFEIINALSAL